MGKKKKDRKKSAAPAASTVGATGRSPSLAGGNKRWFIAAIALILLSGIAIYVARFRASGALQAGRYRDYNVMLITLDTTRADRLPAYGYNGIRAPNLDRLAAESYLFEDAIAHVPLTLPSHASMMTGRLPIAHGVRDNSGFFVDQKEITLAEILKKAAYATSAFVSAFVLESRWQLNQGFDFYYDNFNLGQFHDIVAREIQRRAGETEIEIEHWLEENKDKKFFTWVHFYDPHDPYDPPEPYRTEYAQRPYDGEIAYVDEVIGKLMAKLEALQLKERTIVILTGDHGEGLGEHGEPSHGMFVYNTTQHVPMMIFLPNAGSGRISGPVGHIDLAPTVLELLGLEIIPQIQGASLVEKINGTEKIQRMAYSESLYAELHYGWSPLESITTDQYRYVRAPHAELYDRKADRGEIKNLIGEKASIGKVLDEKLSELLSKYSSANLAGPQKMDPETEEKLRALGYIGTTARSTEESRKIDPKDKVHLARKLQQATYALQQKSFRNAIQFILPVLKEDPNMVDAHFTAGVAYLGAGQLDQAIDELAKTISFRPEHTMALYNLGFAYELKNNLNDAKHWYLEIIKNEPRHMLANVKLAHIFRQQNQPELAKKYFLTAESAYKDALQTTRGADAKASLLFTLGEIYFGAGEIDKAEASFRQALQLAPKKESLNYNLAMIYETKEDFVSAAEAYKKEIEVAPDNFKALNNLGLIYKDSNRLSEAALCFQKVIQLDPQQPNGYVLLASTYRKMGREQDAVQVLYEARQRNVPLQVQ